MVSFDVTHEVVIGTVSTDEFGGLGVLESAFLLIARHGKDGSYRFPGPDEEMTTVVTVEGIETNYMGSPDDAAAKYKPRRKS